MLSKFKIFMFSLIFIATPTLCAADITRITTLNDLMVQLETLDKNDLVIFDLDDVVIQPEDQIFHPNNKKHLAQYYGEIQSKVTPEQMDVILSTVNIEQKVKLVDPKIKELFAALRKNSIPTVALTHCGTGKFGKIKDVANCRINQLVKVGVNFRNLSPYKNQVYSNLKGKHGTAMFKSGILFTGYIEKGDVLAEFLQSNKITPRRIIFIDDRRSNLDNVAAALKARNLNFTGYEYVAVAEQQTNEIDTSVTDVQFHVLQNENKWLPDSNAKSKALN